MTAKPVVAATGASATAEGPAHAKPMTPILAVHCSRGRQLAAHAVDVIKRPARFGRDLAHDGLQAAWSAPP